MLGTRFVVSQEANSHTVYREKILAASETSTVYTTLFDGGWEKAAHRVLRNVTYQRWVAAGCPPPGQRPGEGEIVAKTLDGREIPRFDNDAPTAEVNGHPEEQALYAGQGVGLVRECKPAAEIVRELLSEAEKTIVELRRRIT